MEEVWKSLIYQGGEFFDFEVSNLGNLRNVKTNTLYKQHLNKTGYMQVCVSLGGRDNKKVFKIHKAVAETFIPNPENKPQVNHIDANKTNNNVENLEWVTNLENSHHAKDNGLMKTKRGEENFFAKLTEEDVRYMRNNYIPKDKEFGCCALARKFGVSHPTVSRILSGESWKHVE